MTGMGGPVVLASAVAVLMLACSLVSLGLLVTAFARRGTTDVAIDACHAVMGVSMAGMLIPGLGIVEPGASTWIWIAVSSLIAAWFAVGLVRDALGGRPGARDDGRPPAHLPHLVLSGAMVYMLVVTAVGTGAMAGGSMHGMGMGTGGPATVPLPTLDIVLACFMVGYAVVLIDRLPALAGSDGIGRPVAPRRDGGAGGVVAPRLAGIVAVVMALGMAYMLVMMFA